VVVSGSDSEFASLLGRSCLGFQKSSWNVTFGQVSVQQWDWQVGVLKILHK
jgi:hypothetical protein